MKTAVVTGASSGIGLAITRKLIESGYKVHGIGRDFSKAPITDEYFIKWICDITDMRGLKRTSRDILLEEPEGIDVLINNAGIAYFAPHEELSWPEIEQMTDTNLKAPLLLCNIFLRSLKKKNGFIINMSSVSGEIQSRWGGTYAATKAALQHFSKNLFNDVRKSGVKVVTIVPDLTDTPFYDHLNFSPGTDDDTHLNPDSVAEAVLNILQQKEGVVITQLTIRPQKHQIEKNKRNK